MNDSKRLIYIINPDRTIMELLISETLREKYTTICEYQANSELQAHILLKYREVDIRTAFEVIYSVIKCFELMPPKTDHPHPPDA